MLSPSWGRGRCRSPFLAAAILAAVVAAAAAQNAIIEQPRATQTSQTGVLSEVDSGLVTQVASSNGSSDVDTSDTPLDAADDRSGAIRGELEENLSRRQVFETKAVPYRFIGFLRCKDGTRCTGALISDRHVLTAGHCVFDYRGTHQIRDPHPRFWPGLNNNQSRITPPQAPYGEVRVEQIALPRQFTAAETNQAFDLAVLTLQRPVTAVGGYFEYDCLTEQDAAPAGEAAADSAGHAVTPPPPPPAPPPPSQVAFRLNVAGYPANSDREMFAAYCANVTFDLSVDELIQHECNTYFGMSGAPMWEYEPTTQTRRICAVHKADALVTGVENLAAPLYAEAVRFIDKALAGQVPTAGAPVLADSQGISAVGRR